MSEQNRPETADIPESFASLVSLIGSKDQLQFDKLDQKIDAESIRLRKDIIDSDISDIEKLSALYCLKSNLDPTIIQQYSNHLDRLKNVHYLTRQAGQPIAIIRRNAVLNQNIRQINFGRSLGRGIKTSSVNSMVQAEIPAQTYRSTPDTRFYISPDVSSYVDTLLNPILGPDSAYFSQDGSALAIGDAGVQTLLESLVDETRAEDMANLEVNGMLLDIYRFAKHFQSNLDQIDKFQGWVEQYREKLGRTIGDLAIDKALSSIKPEEYVLGTNTVELTKQAKSLDMDSDDLQEATYWAFSHRFDKASQILELDHGIFEN